MISIFWNAYSLNQIMSTEGGIAFRVDLAVNRGLSGSLAVLKRRLNKFYLNLEVQIFQV